MQQRRNGFIGSLVRLCNGGKHLQIRPAPCRYELQKFGGPLTIEEFRSGFIGFEGGGDDSLFQTSRDDITLGFTKKTPCREIEFV